jgi:hypothetical protein
LRIRDVNGDGKDDLVFLAASVKVLTGRGGFLFDPPQTFLAGLYSVDIDIGDVDRDGRLDAVVASDGLFTLLHGVSNGVFGRSPVFPAGGSIGAMLTADFNQDGHPDLAVADAGTGKISIFFGDGAGGVGSFLGPPGRPGDSLAGIRRLQRRWIPGLRRDGQLLLRGCRVPQ